VADMHGSGEVLFANGHIMHTHMLAAVWLANMVAITEVKFKINNKYSSLSVFTLNITQINSF